MVTYRNILHIMCLLHSKHPKAKAVWYVGVIFFEARGGALAELGGYRLAKRNQAPLA